ncbi:MAG: alpha/beta hydrolase [Candidatus Accumulibacter sp. UW26]|uniref:alpha/beta fold hydrolase n=1 Tax=Candidatus Accumulibacter contiguus TaxID=2954381 RepID=UPI002FC2F8E0
MGTEPAPPEGEAMVRANGINLCYQSLGDPGAPVILLIMGLGMQLIAWPDAFCASLVERGFRVIRFDNRDVGHSTHVVWGQRPRVLLAVARGVLGLPVRSPYRLSDMADDAIGLLDALQVERAHVVGASMGGMIGQCMAARHPARLLSLTSIMSGSGNWRVACGRPAVLRQILRRPARPDDPASQVDHLMRLFGVIGSPGFSTDQAELRRQLERGVGRALYPVGPYQQLLAIVAAGDRRRELARIRVPTLVIHGADDPLLPVAAGRETARYIAGARLQVIQGMGHDLPPGVQALLLEGIVSHCRGADKAGAAGARAEQEA